MPVDPTMLTTGSEWSVGGLGGLGQVGTTGAAEAGREVGGASFGDLMAKQVASLDELQTDASAQSQALALGTAEDPSAAVLAVERARLSMQLAVNVRSKLTDAFNEVMRTQV
jgi:flagellar hook-basal body complex protein FliE